MVRGIEVRACTLEQAEFGVASWTTRWQSCHCEDSMRRYKMYVLARHEDEEIIIADVIRIKVLSVTGKIVRLGIEAPKEVPVKRAELIDDKHR